MQAMILAAGFGTRLLPHTAQKPKPLFPILNKPLLLLIIERLQRAGFDHIIVNCHHLKSQIVEAVAVCKGVLVQEEGQILGTGGGLRKAMANLRDEPLLVCNGDIYHTIDYRAVYQAHDSSAAATLAMHDLPRFNQVEVKDNRVVGFHSGREQDKLAFTGIHIIDPQILAGIEEGRKSCIITRYKELLDEDSTISVYRTDASFWLDMGTEKDYLALHKGLLTGTMPRWPELEFAGKSAITVSEAAALSSDSKIDDWCAIGAAQGKGVHLSRVVVWDDVVLPDGFQAKDCLISSSPEDPVNQR